MVIPSIEGEEEAEVEVEEEETGWVKDHFRENQMEDLEEFFPMGMQEEQ